jgi:phosphate transport system protein
MQHDSRSAAQTPLSGLPVVAESAPPSIQPVSGPTAGYPSATRVPGILEQVEVDTLAGLDLVVAQLGRILHALRDTQAESTEGVTSAYERLTASRSRLHHDVVELIAETALGVPDLRLVAALLNVMPCVARMGEQCVILSKLTQHLAPAPLDRSRAYDAIGRMGELTQSQVKRAKRAFAARDGEVADGLLRRDADLKRLGRVVFDSAIAARRVQPTTDSCTLAMLAAQCLEHIGDDALEVGEQGYLIVADGFNRTSQPAW